VVFEQRPPIVQRGHHGPVERLIDETVDDPLHFAPLEDEDDFVRGEVDGVPLQPASARIEADARSTVVHGAERKLVSPVALCWQCDRVALPVVISRESVGGAVIPFWVPRMTASASAGLAGLPPGGASIFGP
jgi:hypothetical protein